MTSRFKETYVSDRATDAECKLIRDREQITTFVMLPSVGLMTNRVDSDRRSNDYSAEAGVWVSVLRCPQAHGLLGKSNKLRTRSFTTGWMSILTCVAPPAQPAGGRQSALERSILTGVGSFILRMPAPEAQVYDWHGQQSEVVRRTRRYKRMCAPPSNSQHNQHNPACNSSPSQHLLPSPFSRLSSTRSRRPSRNGQLVGLLCSSSCPAFKADVSMPEELNVRQCPWLKRGPCTHED
ncbi:hypothetical protein FA95DRAFT_1413960 [Auriscalpium vulgare]|uniref:Uncharacterized protein n=1 Tax=Auriscalpium vulgare TaxID=40419 RepID=A0ACB8RQ76_9AGAM|nr:hypothetical protein FA95DRAFT_1413960 [Auriscalpium vulgare]